jgi:hypothetical protein
MEKNLAYKGNTMQKYRPLGDYLVKQNEVSVSLTFQEIEQILGFTLPLSAYNHRAWWANSRAFQAFFSKVGSTVSGFHRR